MTTCVRCGLTQTDNWAEAEFCSAHLPDSDSSVIDCRNRELSNLRALLRAQTRRLENMRQQCDDILEAIS